MTTDSEEIDAIVAKMRELAKADGIRLEDVIETEQYQFYARRAAEELFQIGLRRLIENQLNNPEFG